MPEEKATIGLRFKVSKNDVEPVSSGARKGAWFVVAIGSLSAIFLVTFWLVPESDPKALLFLLPMVLLVHVMGSVALTGFAPFYLRFAHMPKGGDT